MWVAFRGGKCAWELYVPSQTTVDGLKGSSAQVDHSFTIPCVG